MVLPLSSLPQIETERLRLRYLELQDAEAFCAVTDEPGIVEAVHFLSNPFTLTDARQLIAGKDDGRDCFWGIWQREKAGLIGTVGTHLRGPDEIEIGYWLGSVVHGRGFGAEAVSAVVRMLGKAYPNRRIFAECRPQNEASWRLLTKVGFRADGLDGARSGRKRLMLDAAEPDVCDGAEWR